MRRFPPVPTPVRTRGDHHGRRAPLSRLVAAAAAIAAAALLTASGSSDQATPTRAARPPVPTTLTVADAVMPAAAATAAGALTQRAIACGHDGSSGNRIAVYYAYLAGRPNRLAAVRGRLVAAIRQANDIVYRSAQQAGGYRSLRVLTDSRCMPIIKAVRLPGSAAGTFAQTIAAAQQARLTAQNRKYVLFLDTNQLCGIATLALDDRPGMMNTSNAGPSWARLDTGCWSGDIAAHEIFHMLGAVQGSAPHNDSTGHCTDDHDLMCYQNRGGKRVYIRCATQRDEDRLDCAKDDYFNPRPRAGSYLATHWNTADSSFLYGGGPAQPVAPGPIGSLDATMTTTSTAVLWWTAPAGSRVTSYQITKDGGIVWTGTATSWTDTDALSGQSTYRVQAVNEAGAGPQSVAVTVTLPTPPAPDQVTASGSSPTTITWDASSELADGYRVYGLLADGTTRYLGQLAADSRSATDYTSPYYKTWSRYRVCAFNSSGEACTDQS